MKKLGLVLSTLLLVLFVGGCTKNNSDKVENANNGQSSTSEVKHSDEKNSDKKVKTALRVYDPTYALDRNELSISGEANDDATVKVSNKEKVLGETTAKNGKFYIYLSLLEEPVNEVNLVISDGETDKTVKVSTKQFLQAEQEKIDAEKKKLEEDAAAAEKAEKEAEEKKKKDDELALQRAKEEEIASYNTGITYENLARNPDTYKNQKVSFYGKILQVIKGDDYSHFRFAIDDNYDQVIYIEISEDQLSNNRILEDDYITIRGLSYGEYTYKSALSGDVTVPGVIVDSFELNN